MTGARVLTCGVYALAGALLFALLPLGIYPLQSAIRVDFATDVPARVVTGVYSSERTPDGLTFAWTRERFGLDLPDLDRSKPWIVHLRLTAARADGTSPQLTGSVDGTTKMQVVLPAVGFTDRTITIPATTNGTRGATVVFVVTPTFVPGAGDPRKLGVQLDSIQLEPPPGWQRLGLPLLPAAVTGVIAGLIIGLLAIPAAWSIGLLTMAGGVAAVIVTRGLAPFLEIAWTPPLVTASAAAGLAWVALPRASTGARIVAGVTFVAVLLKLLVLLHPDMPIGDTMFHAHRFQDVLAGKYVFTSIAPGNYRFPYPIGLYIIAWPLARLGLSGVDNMTLLRCVVVAADAIAAALLFRFGMAWRQDARTGVAAVVIYHFMPLTFAIIATANLTNEFAQSLAMVVLAIVGSLTALLARAQAAGAFLTSSRRAIVIAGFLMLVSCAAFLSHTSTFAVLGTQLVFTGAFLLFSRNVGAKRAGWLVLITTAIALALAIGLYYSRFMDVYREAFARIATETGHATAAAGGRTPMTRFSEIPRLLSLWYGLPAMMMAVFGAVTIVRRRGQPTSGNAALGLVLGAWLLACVCFLVVGIITPVDLRHSLAALPLIALVAAVGFSDAWRGGLWSKLAAIAVAMGIAWLGAVSWLNAIAS